MGIISGWRVVRERVGESHPRPCRQLGHVDCFPNAGGSEAGTMLSPPLKLATHRKYSATFSCIFLRVPDSATQRHAEKPPVRCRRGIRPRREPIRFQTVRSVPKRVFHSRARWTRPPERKWRALFKRTSQNPATSLPKTASAGPPTRAALIWPAKLAAKAQYSAATALSEPNPVVTP